MANAVLVIDMLRGFLEEECPLYCGNDARRIIPTIRTLLGHELARSSKIFFLCDRHAPNDLEFRMFPPHCIDGTNEADIIPELAGYHGEVIPKTRYSAFFNNEILPRPQLLEKVVSS